LVLHRGEITNTEITTLLEHKLFLYSAIARPGNSGGPVISSSGNVVGLVTEELLGQDSPNAPFYAGVGGEEVAKAISEIGVPVRLPIEIMLRGQSTGWSPERLQDQCIDGMHLEIVSSTRLSMSHCELLCSS